MTAFLLSILPDFVFHLIVLIGVAGVIIANFFGAIPFVSIYKTPIQIVAIIILTFGVYFEGGLATQKEWELKVAEAEKKALQKQAASAETNTKIQYVYVEKTKYIRDVEKSAVEQVAKKAEVIDSKCVITPDVTTILNAAARNQKVEASK